MYVSHPSLGIVSTCDDDHRRKEIAFVLCEKGKLWRGAGDDGGRHHGLEVQLIHDILTYKEVMVEAKECLGQPRDLFSVHDAKLDQRKVRKIGRFLPCELRTLTRVGPTLALTSTPLIGTFLVSGLSARESEDMQSIALVLHVRYHYAARVGSVQRRV